MTLSVLELCAGGGGQSIGLEQAGFHHAAAVEINPDACQTLRLNRPDWRVIQTDIRDLSAAEFRGVDVVSGGVPCPPFSIAGRQLGADDERDLFPAMLRLVAEIVPKAVMIENVRGLATSRFRTYLESLLVQFQELGYVADWRVLNASDFGVPQLRPRFVLVALREPFAERFRWPEAIGTTTTVSETIFELMAAGGWPGAKQWAEKARTIAPTIVGGSAKHGGPDLGPTRARAAWKELGVNGVSLADSPPGADFPEDGLPRLTVPMVARIQGFPEQWKFAGSKTAAYRQVGNAFPPPVARSVALAVKAALENTVPVDSNADQPYRARQLQLVS